MNPSTSEPSPEDHSYPSDVEKRPPRDVVLRLPRLVHLARAGFGPRATLDAVLAALRQRRLDVSGDDVVRGWDEQC
ncbi:MAG TPA: hypothetical protein VKE40_23010 [Gemmataceae bacterium]|nr:hypothetical protein [Gemmataceae bacterium]